MKHSKPAFAMITVVFLIILMATIAAFVLNLSGKMVQATTAQYQREQAMLLARSYTEYAILAVMSNDRAANCLHTITGDIGDAPATGDGYQARVEIRYIGNFAQVGTCGANILSSTVAYPQSPLNIIVDTYIQYRDLDNANQWLTFHKRTLQKI